MNYYICASIVTILSLLIPFSWKYSRIKEKEYLLLYILLSLPLSAVVNIFIKAPIFSYLLIIFNIDNELTQWPIWFSFIITIIGPLLEEGIKLLPLLILIKLLSMDKLRIYLLGILIGIGFGIGEAWYLGYSFSEGMPEYISGLKNLGMLLLGFGGERFLATLIHALLTGMVAFGILIKEPIRYFFLAVLFHFLINIPACLYQLGWIPQQIISGILTIIIFCFLFFSVFLKIEERIRIDYEKSILQKQDKILYNKKD